jgi:cytochrome P450
MIKGSKTEQPPKLKGSIFSGSYFDFFQNQLGFLSKCAKEYGDIVSLRFFHLPIYLINHPDLIEEVFSTNSANFKKAKTVRLPSQRLLFGNSLLVSDGEIWLQQRRAIQPAFHQNFINNYSKIVTETAEEFIKNWKTGEVHLINEDLVDLTFAVASRAFFGIDGSSEKEIIRDLVNLNKSIFASQNRLSWFWDNFLPTPKNLRFGKAVQKVNQLISNLIQERRAQDLDKKDLLSVLLSIKNNETEGLNDKQLRDEIITIFIAGHETTAVTLSWIWVLLSQNPEEFLKLKNELKNVLNNRLPNFTDLPKLEHTYRIIKESLRLFPPNRSTAREAIKDCQIGKYFIPAGSQVVMSQWVVHRDERFFDSPNEFIPDRWTNEFEQKLHKYAYFPFGGGGRICIGRSFAMMEAALILALIAQKFEITLDEQNEIEPIPLVLLRPKSDLKVTLTLST